MIKNRFLICLFILSIWFSTTGFQPSLQNQTFPAVEGSRAALRLSTAASAADAVALASSNAGAFDVVTFGKIYPANNARGISTTNLTLQWSAAQGYTGPVTYRYCLQTKTKCPPGRWLRVGSNTSVTLKTLAPNTTYYWWVRAYDSQNNVIASADNGQSWTFTTMNVPGAFAKIAPANLTTGVSTGSLQLSWTASPGATSYEYCLDTTNNNRCDSSWVQVAGSSTTAAVSGLYSNAVYYWQVRAVNAGGSTQANGGTWWQFTTQILPGVFNKLFPAINAQNQPAVDLTISWEISSTAISYEYCVSKTNNNTDCAPGGWQPAGSDTSALIGSLDYSTDYFWQARAKNSGGYTLADGNTWWKFTTQAPPPAPFSKLAPSNGATRQPVTLDLSWEMKSGVDSYEYCLTTTPDTTTSTWDCDAPWTSVTGSPVSLTDLDYAATYYWQVHAINASGTTDANTGGWWSFTTQMAPPAPFYKTNPQGDATNQPINLNFTWSPSDPGITYEFCFREAANTTACAADQDWMTTTSTSVAPANLAYGKTYSWQVRAKNNEATRTEADNGAWYNFSTYPNAPTKLVKILPADGWQKQPKNGWLYWATDVTYGQYEYCVAPTIDLKACGNSKWSTTTSTSVPLTGLADNTPYFWQVRVLGASGYIYANAGDAQPVWKFITLPTPPASSDVTINANEDSVVQQTLKATSSVPPTFALYAQAPDGDLMLNTDGTFTYTPPLDYYGPISFQFTVSDGLNTPSGPYTVTMNFAPVNDPPVLDPIPDITLTCGETAIFTANATDVDLPAGKQLTYAIGSLPAGATFDAATGAFRWQAIWSPTAPKSYTLTVTVTDDQNATDQKTVRITPLPRMVYLPLIKR